MSREERIFAEMEAAKQDAMEFLVLAEQYEAEGEALASEIAWKAHKLALKQYHDASLFYTKIAAM